MNLVSLTSSNFNALPTYLCLNEIRKSLTIVFNREVQHVVCSIIIVLQHIANPLVINVT